MTSPFWGVALAGDIVSRGIETGRFRTRYDDADSLALDPGFEFGAYHALVIGNQEYRHTKRLTTPARDADDVSTMLRDLYGFETTAVHDATRAEMIAALVALRAKIDPPDNLLIYYAGHGLFDEEVSEGYWLPIDANLQDPSTWLSTTTVSTMLRGIRAKHILIVADSCYSGVITREVTTPRRTRGYIYKLAKKPARMAMTSGGLEPVQDEGGGANSIFAKYFLLKLRENALSVLEGSDLFLQIRQPVMENALQTPEYAPIRLTGHDGGDFLFLRSAVDTE